MPYRLGNILVAENLCSKENIEKALDYQKETGFLLGECLILLNLCSEEYINYAIHKQIEINSKRHKKGFSLKDLHSLFKIIFSYKLLFSSVIIFSLIAAVFSSNIILPILIGLIIDNAIPLNDINQIFLFCIAGMLGLFIGNIANFFLSNIVVILISRVCKNIQETLFRHLTNVPYIIFQKFKKGDILSRFSDNTETIAMQLNNMLVLIFQNTFLFLIVFILLLNFNIILTLLTLFIIILCNFIPATISDKSNQYVVENPKILGSISSFLKEGLFVFKYIKTNNKISVYMNKLNSKMEYLYRNNYRMWKYWTVAFSVKIVLTSLVLAIILLYGGNLVIQNKMSAGNLIVFFLLASQFIPKSEIFYAIYFRFQFLRKTWIRISEVFSFPETSKNLNNREKNKIIESINNIDIKDLGFKYSVKSNNIFSNLNMTLKKDNIYAIIGKSGTGKSSFINLIMGLYNPTTGYIYYNSVSHDKMDIYNLWVNIGYMRQESVIFNNMTIYDNILMGASGIKDVKKEDVYLASKKANIYDFIMSLPKGFNTVIGIDNVILSGGEKQRISLARILLRKPSILIFDEPTSALDHENSKLVMETILKESFGKIVLLISHDINLLKDSKNLIYFTNTNIEFIENDNDRVKLLVENLKKESEFK